MFALLTIVLIVGSALSNAGQSKPYYIEDDIEQLFEVFITKYNKTYESEEEMLIRFEIFKENVIKINELNQGPHLTIYAINPFTDLTTEEFLQRYTGFTYNSEFLDYCETMSIHELKPAPESFDWRTQGVVTPVKYQQNCGSCWAFSVTGNVESHYALKYHQQIDLSEQQLVDCNEHSDCILGGNIDEAIRVLMKEGGQMLESDYPYQGQQFSCQFIPGRNQVRVKGCSRIITQDEEMLKSVLYTYGPLSFGLNSSSLHMYEGSIHDHCTYGEPDHAVLLVGYGSENGVPYWLVKNSWGSWWGDNGYAKIARGENACNMLHYGFVVADVM